MLPALADGFLTTGPPEKSPRNFYIVRIMHDKKVSLCKLCNLKKLEKKRNPYLAPIEKPEGTANHCQSQPALLCPLLARHAHSGVLGCSPSVPTSLVPLVQVASLGAALWGSCGRRQPAGD